MNPQTVEEDLGFMLDALTSLLMVERAGATALAEAVQASGTLTMLDLGSNVVGTSLFSVSSVTFLPDLGCCDQVGSDRLLGGSCKLMNQACRLAGGMWPDATVKSRLQKVDHHL